MALCRFMAIGEGGDPRMGYIRISVLVLLLITSTSYAQTAPPETVPWTMSDEELENSGWVYESEGSRPGNVIGGVLATTIGTVIHGVGHLYSGDVRTGTSLLIGEGISLAFIGVGVLTEMLSETDGDLAPIYRSTTALGASLFVATWLLDVIGTFKGTRLAFPPHGGSLTDVSLTASASYLVEEGLPLQQVAEIDFDSDMGAVFFSSKAKIGLDHDYLAFGLAAGLRFGLGRRPLSNLEIQFEGHEVIFGDLGFAYETIVASLGLSIDLGDAFAHLDGIAFQNRIGFGTQLYRFDFDGGSPLNADSSSGFMVVEAYLSANPAPSLLAEVGYIQRPDTLVSGLSDSVGLFFLGLTYAVSSRVDLFLDARLGGGAQLFSGTTVYFRR